MITAFLTNVSNRHSRVLPETALGIPTCVNCTSVLHCPPYIGYENQTEGPACEWMPHEELRTAARLLRFDRTFPTRRHWHHTLHRLFELDCDDLCKPSRAANHNAKTSGHSGLIVRIKKAYRLEDIVSRIGRLRGNGATLTGRCPLHNEKQGRALVVWTELQKWRCYGKCGIGGDVIDFVRECESRGIDWRGRSAAANGGRGRH